MLPWHDFVILVIFQRRCADAPRTAELMTLRIRLIPAVSEACLDSPAIGIHLQSPLHAVSTDGDPHCSVNPESDRAGEQDNDVIQIFQTVSAYLVHPNCKTRWMLLPVLFYMRKPVLVLV